ncbi:hypothetical protein K438DRAFT_1733783, partial [Mycena galopus ATCC 62051]
MLSSVTDNVVRNRGNLTGLHVVGLKASSEIWTLLLSDPSLHQLELKEITTDKVTNDLLTYLASYCGLRRLTLINPDGSSFSESDQLADVFYKTVLPLHADSLVELSCPSDYETRWSFGAHCLDTISRMHSAEKLEFSVNADDVLGADLEHNVVTRLLQATTRFPALRYLAIFPADRPNPGGKCGIRNSSMYHAAAVNKGVIAAVLAFRTGVPSRALLHAGFNWYE